MLKRTLLLILFVLPFQLFSGNFSVNFGLNHSWLYYPDISVIDNETNINYSLGINYAHKSIYDLELSYGLRLFEIGRYDKLKFNDITEKINIRHIYVSLPVRIGYRFFGAFEPYFNLEPGLLVFSSMEQSGSLIDGTEKQNITDEMNRVNLFAGTGLKYLFSILNQQFGLASYINFGLLRVSKDSKLEVTENSYHRWADWRTRELVVTFEYYF